MQTRHWESDMEPGERDLIVAKKWLAALEGLTPKGRFKSLSEFVALERAVTTRTSAVMTLAQIKNLLIQGEGQPIEKVGPLLFQAIADYISAIEADYTEFMEKEGNAVL